MSSCPFLRAMEAMKVGTTGTPPKEEEEGEVAARAESQESTKEKRGTTSSGGPAGGTQEHPKRCPFSGSVLSSPSRPPVVDTPNSKEMPKDETSGMPLENSEGTKGEVPDKGSKGVCPMGFSSSSGAPGAQRASNGQGEGSEKSSKGVCPMGFSSAPGHSTSTTSTDADVSAQKAAPPSSVPPGVCPLGFSSSGGVPKVRVGELECGLCLALLFQPLRCVPCKHIFCRGCIGTVRDCPGCGADVVGLEEDDVTSHAVDLFISAHILSTVTAPAPDATATSAPPVAATSAPDATAISAPSSSANTSVTSPTTSAPAPAQAAVRPAQTQVEGSVPALSTNGVAVGTAASSPKATEASAASRPGPTDASLVESTTTEASAASETEATTAPPRPPVLVPSLSSPSSFLFLQAMRAAKKGNLESAIARLSLCVSELRTELKLLQASQPKGLQRNPDTAQPKGIGRNPNAAQTDQTQGTKEGPPNTYVGRLQEAGREGGQLEKGEMEQLAKGEMGQLEKGEMGVDGWQTAVAEIVSRLGAALGTLADCCGASGDVDSAAAHFLEAVALLKGFLFEETEGHLFVQHQGQRSSSEGNEGMSASGEGDEGLNTSAEAIEGQSTSVEVKTENSAMEKSTDVGIKFRIRHSAAASEHMEMLNTLAVTVNKVGDLRYRCEDYTSALSEYKYSLSLRRQALQLSDVAPSARVGLELDVAISMAKVADAEQELSHKAAAEEGFRMALEIAERSIDGIQRTNSSAQGNEAESAPPPQGREAPPTQGNEAESAQKHNQALNGSGKEGSGDSAALDPAILRKREHVISMLKSQLK